MNLDASIDAPETDTLRLGKAGADTACLLLHGFTGTPWDLEPLARALEDRGHQVLVPRLPGHGTTPRALNEVTHLDWERAAEEALLSLGHARRLFVAGFSMGGLLGLLLAARVPERVHALGLLAPAVRLSGTRMALLRRFRRLPILETLRPYLDKGGVDMEDPSARAAAPRLSAFPSARLKDLWTLQDKAWREAPRVHAPLWLAMAEHDHVVSLEGGRALLERLPRGTRARTILLKQGFHNVVRDRAGTLAIAELVEFFERQRGI